MKSMIVLALVSVTGLLTPSTGFGLSSELHQPDIFFPKAYDTNRAAQVLEVLRGPQFKFLGGMTSYWEPAWATTLVYDGGIDSLNEFLAALHKIDGIRAKLSFSRDLSRETGSALPTGSWWVKYAHTEPDTITVRINLAEERLVPDKARAPVKAR